MIKEENSERWKKYVEKYIKANTGKVRKTVQSLDRKFNPGNVNEVLVEQKQDGRKIAYIEDKDEANLFAKTYKQFTQLPATKMDRKLKRRNVESLRRRRRQNRR